MRNPALPGLALLLLGIGILVYYALSVTTLAGGLEFGRPQTESLSSAPLPAPPLAAGWIVMTGGIAWLVAGPRGARA